MTLLEWLIVIFAAWLAFGKPVEPRSRLVFPEKPTRVPQVRCPPPPPCPKCDWVGTPSGPILCNEHRQVIRPKPPVPSGPRTS